MMPPVPDKPIVSNEWRSEKVERVCFRGDDRSPDQLYKNAFQEDTSISRSGLAPQDSRLEPAYRQEKPGAIGDAENGVCVSKLFETAVRFPLLSGRPMTWIYAVWVVRAYDTHRRQVLDGMALLEKKLRYANLAEQEMKDTLWGLFGEEMVVNQIPPHHTIAAVRCQRYNVQDLKDWNTAIEYRLSGPLWINPDCSVESSIRQAAIDFLATELSEYPEGTSTVAASGFTRTAST